MKKQISLNILFAQSKKDQTQVNHTYKVSPKYNIYNNTN